MAVPAGFSLNLLRDGQSPAFPRVSRGSPFNKALQRLLPSVGGVSWVFPGGAYLGRQSCFSCWQNWICLARIVITKTKNPGLAPCLARIKWEFSGSCGRAGDKRRCSRCANAHDEDVGYGAHGCCPRNGGTMERGFFARAVPSSQAVGWEVAQAQSPAWSLPPRCGCLLGVVCGGSAVGWSRQPDSKHGQTSRPFSAALGSQA